MPDNVSERLFTIVWRNDPDLAVEAGHLPPVLWEDLSPRHRDETVLAAEALIAELDDQGDVPERQAARYHADCTRSLVKWRGIDMLNHMTGPAARLSWAAASWPWAADPNAEMYVERLREFPAFCDAVVRQSEHWDTPGSRPVLDGFIAQVDAIMRTPATTALPGGATPREVADGVSSGLLALRSLAVKALTSARPGSPLAQVPDGPERYADAIHRGTSLPMSAARVESLGHTVLSRTQERYERLLQSHSAGFELLPSAASYLERMREIHARLVAALPAVSSKLPRMACEVTAMPEANATVGPPAYYGPSSQHNGRAGSLYVNMAEPVTVRDWDVLPLAMHEGVPGHHLQLALLDENQSLPDTVRLLSVNAFTEGWAVYSETLAPVLGLELTAADEFGLLTHQRWRAARLVVDVGLHVHGWSVDTAVTFMVEQTGLDRVALRREVIRYLAWPGQALGYMVGAEAVSSWVAAQRARGVPLATAHADLLQRGSIPLSVLAAHGQD